MLATSESNPVSDGTNFPMTTTPKQSPSGSTCISDEQKISFTPSPSQVQSYQQEASESEIETEVERQDAEVSSSVERKGAEDREKKDYSGLEPQSPNTKMAEDAFNTYVSFCKKHNLKESFQFLNPSKGKRRDMTFLQHKNMILAHNQRLREYREMSHCKDNGRLHADINRAEEKASKNQKLVEKKIEEVKNQKKQEQSEEEEEEQTPLQQHFSKIKETSSQLPNFYKDHRCPDPVKAIAESRSSQIDVVEPMYDANGRHVPSKQPGLARVRLGTYLVVSAVVRRITASVSLLLYDPNVMTLARQYAQNILEDVEKPPGKDNTGGLSYSSYVDLGEDHVEIYAVASIIKSLQSAIILWRATPRITPLPQDWQLMTAVAAFATAAGTLAASVPKHLASIMAAPVSIFLGDQKTVLSNIHRHFYPSDNSISKIKSLLGFATKPAPGALHIANNLDLSTLSYQTEEFAAALPANFQMSPVEDSPLSGFHQLDSEQSLDYLGESQQPALDASGRQNQRNQDDPGRAWSCWGPLQQGLDSIRQWATKTARSVASSVAYCCTVKRCPNPQPVRCISTSTYCEQKCPNTSYQNCPESNPPQDKPGSADSTQLRERNSSCVSKNSTPQNAELTSRQQSFAKEKRRASSDESYLVVESPLLNTWMTETFVPAMTSLNAGLDRQCILLRSALKNTGTTILGCISTCPGRMKKWVSGTHGISSNSERQRARSSIVAGWTLLKENLRSCYQSVYYDRSEYQPILQKSSNGSSIIAPPRRATGYGSTDELCSELESQIQPLPTLSSQQQRLSAEHSEEEEFPE